MKQLNVPAEIKDILWNSGVWEDLPDPKLIKLTRDLTSLIEQVGKEIIGEDMTSVAINGVYNNTMSERIIGTENRLKAAQRQTLNALLKGEKDG